MSPADRVHVLIQDKGNQVYQVPESVFPRPGGAIPSQQSNLKFSYTASPFSFNITRAKTGEVIFNTSPASLVFESQYLRLRTSLPANPNLYGLGEHQILSACRPPTTSARCGTRTATAFLQTQIFTELTPSILSTVPRALTVSYSSTPTEWTL